MSLQSQPKGFTITELLLVVTILVILGLVVLVGLNPMTQLLKGYDTRRRADIEKIRIALEAYYSDHDCYPLFPQKDSLNRPTYECGSSFLSPYLNSMPCDPNDQKPYTVYLSPENAVCPQQYAVYAQIYSFFDKEANSIQNCSKTITVHSSDMTIGEINYGCSGFSVCSDHYGCQDGVCKHLSGSEDPGCSTNYCTDNCGGVDCSNPTNACI